MNIFVLISVVEIALFLLFSIVIDVFSKAKCNIFFLILVRLVVLAVVVIDAVLSATLISRWRGTGDMIQWTKKLNNVQIGMILIVIAVISLIFLKLISGSRCEKSIDSIITLSLGFFAMFTSTLYLTVKLPKRFEMRKDFVTRNSVRLNNKSNKYYSIDYSLM